MAFVCALLAVVCFFLVLIGASVGIDLTVLGLLLVAASLAFSAPTPRQLRRN